VADRVVVLCEDAAQRDFAHSLCRRMGLRVLRTLAAPSGHGAASAWVRRNYAAQVKALRAKVHQTNLGLLVVIDGDDVGTAQRLAALDAELVGATAARRQGEAIALLVPTWSIETWLLWLCGQNVNERATYKASAVLRSVAPTPRRAMEGWEPARSNEATQLPSLACARAELARL
jgi:hypothetical protein